MAFIEIDRLERSIGGNHILKGIDVALEKGGFLVLVGPSGCGKSTLLNAIAGLQPPTAGDIRIDGQSVLALHPSKRDIAMVFQSYALYPNMTVAQNIGFPLEMSGTPKAQREDEIRAVGKTLQIEHLLDRRPGQLSGGQRQRVAMARALVRKPRLFLFDEPLSNLDAKLRVEVRAEIKRLHQQTGATIIYVTHDQIEAMTLATQIVVMKDGVIQQSGTPAEIYNRPANMFVADFMGSPAMNMLPGQVAGDGRHMAPDAAPDRLLPLPFALRVGRRIVFGIRSENISAEGNGVEALDLPVEIVEPTGSDVFVWLRLGSAHLSARLPATSDPQLNENLRITMDISRAVIFDGESRERIDGAGH
ncbi:ABC transporter ATP-binding protein [Paracoccus litorisediminis]|uniref:ATP-binding cassette domain-containing protein n=1 Tax=Paracoccus litorisediminis TaxID=2006130 RepID=A0A844HKI1_9RHOB|nr:ABC transporter ATP-binding protein [Paracoccus litorisediminis]MTH59508.1 ATP-binding cassette domain-containing protein [Paracoccus litorisediminis]